jgi:hypothetical protein
VELQAGSAPAAQGTPRETEFVAGMRSALSVLEALSAARSSLLDAYKFQWGNDVLVRSDYAPGGQVEL